MYIEFDSRVKLKSVFFSASTQEEKAKLGKVTITGVSNTATNNYERSCVSEIFDTGFYPCTQRYGSRNFRIHRESVYGDAFFT